LLTSDSTFRSSSARAHFLRRRFFDGVDVMGRHDVAGAMCRLDLPTRERILAALTR
jgi:hypothetical protein